MTTILGGRYRLGEVLGVGGMGQVFAATDERLDRDVAVKVLRADFARDPVARTRFRREARAAARLTHPHVVTVYDTAHGDDEAYLVMERCPGATLADELRHGPVTADRLRTVGHDVASALAAAHAAGIVHRDVKPANVLVGPDGQLKVADFGIAKAFDDATDATLATATMGHGFGTPAYTAPERLRGEAATPASDIWSLGVLLYEAAAGERPLAGAHRRLRELRPELDAPFVAAVEEMLQPDPARRPADGDAALRALTAEGTVPTVALPATATIAAPVAPTGTRARRPASSRRAARVAIPAELVAAAALVVVLLTAGAGSGGGADPVRKPAATAVTAAAPTPSTMVTTLAPTTVPVSAAPTATPATAGHGPPAEHPGKAKGHDKG